MKRHLYLLIVCGALFSCFFGWNIATSRARGKALAACAVQKVCTDRSAVRDHLWNPNDWSRSQRQSALSGSQELFSISLADMERLPLPLWKSARWKAIHLQTSCYKQYCIFLQRKSGRGVTPYDCEAPADYYVVALRHLLC